LEDPSPREYTYYLRQQFAKSKAVATLIDAYMTNGEDLPDSSRRPVGIRIMRDALCDSGIFAQSEKTLDNAFIELEPASVFHYLIWFQGCREVLRPEYPSSPRFARLILRRARSADELAGVCQMYNTVASELNQKYGFAFCIIENVPQIEPIYNSPPTRHSRNPELAEHIRTVAGRTG
jgi:hypothetical protein